MFLGNLFTKYLFDVNHQTFSYRGYDCRANLHYTQEGDIVYHIAAIGIVLSKNSGVQKHYLQHSDDILCLALFRASKDLVATGQVLLLTINYL